MAGQPSSRQTRATCQHERRERVGAVLSVRSNSSQGRCCMAKSGSALPARHMRGRQRLGSRHSRDS
eukprot:scaffold194175_cov31-Tisochrysis_lutea.AAC.4